MSHDHQDAHEGPIKTPKQLAWAVLFAYVVPILTIILLAYAVTSHFKPAAGTAPKTLRVRYQGCADIGVCYPPQTKLVAVR